MEREHVNAISATAPGTRPVSFAFSVASAFIALSSRAGGSTISSQKSGVLLFQWGVFVLWQRGPKERLRNEAGACAASVCRCGDPCCVACVLVGETAVWCPSYIFKRAA